MSFDATLTRLCAAGVTYKHSPTGFWFLTYGQRSVVVTNRTITAANIRALGLDPTEFERAIND